MQEEKILSLTIKQWVELIDTNEAKAAQKALNYFDGLQLTEMEKLLSCPYKGRRKWQERGIIPRFRNLTNMVVEKSAKLFKDTAPKIEVFNNGSIDELLTEQLSDLLYKANWLEVFNNADSVIRLLKTGLILTQFDPEENAFQFEILHRGNCSIIVDGNYKSIQGLIFKTSELGKIETYRIITKEEYIDLIEVEENDISRISISNRVPNPYGIIPVTAFHDTHLPRNGFWNVPGLDLISMNELYNLHLTDSEYAISWAKFPTLFMIDCELADTSSETEEVVYPGEKIPRTVPVTGGMTGGPSKAIALMSNGTNSASIEYKAPDVAIEPLDNVVNNWVEQFSFDWSVKLTVGGSGSATSGFQVVVEEIPNKELRQQRAKMMQYSFSKLFSVIRTIINTQFQREVFPSTAELFIEFNVKSIPVDEKTNEEVWDLRIAGNRASIVDYLIEEKGLSKEEATQKMLEIKSINRFEQTAEAVKN